VANAICEPINELYALYEAAKESGEGKLPVVAFLRADAEVGKHGTNYVPIFEIQKWVDRPAEFDEANASDEAAPLPAANGGATSTPAKKAAGKSEF